MKLHYHREFGKIVKQEDGSMMLANEHDQGFMVNQAIIDFWRSCNGKKKVTELVELFAQQTGLQRSQVEKEVMQLLKQLNDGGLIIIHEIKPTHQMWILKNLTRFH